MKKFLLQYRWYLLMNVFSLLVIVGSVWYVFKPVTLPVSASPAQVADARQLGLEWLANNFLDGLFRYQFDPETNETPQRSNELRQLMASRVIASEAKSNEVFTNIHGENLQFIFSEWYQEDERGGYVFTDDKSKLGGNAMLLRTLVASPDFLIYRDKAEMVAKGIVALQNEDGSFVPWYVEPDYEYDADYLLHFYSGEAILALLEYYEKSDDEIILRAAEKSADYYLLKYVAQIEENYHPAYVPWHTMAYVKLYELSQDQRYLDAIYIMNDRLIELIDTRIYPGRFYRRELVAEGQGAPHTSSDAVYLEGLLYAYELAKENGEVERAERYKQVIDLAVTRLVALQYKSEMTDFAATPGSYIGAIPIRESTPSIRVDTTQHALDAFEKYLSIFGSSKNKEE